VTDVTFRRFWRLGNVPRFSQRLYERSSGIDVLPMTCGRFDTSPFLIIVTRSFPIGLTRTRNARSGLLRLPEQEAGGIPTCEFNRNLDT
jgi:hypothetical protein